MAKNCVSESSIKSNDTASTATGDVSSQQSSAATTPRVPIPKKSCPRPLSATLNVASSPKPRKQRPASATTKSKKTAKKASGAQEQLPPPVPFTTPENTSDTLVNTVEEKKNDPENEPELEPLANSDSDSLTPRAEEGQDDNKKSEEKEDTDQKDNKQSDDSVANASEGDPVQDSDGPIPSKRNKRPVSAAKTRKRIGSDDGDYTLPRQSAIFANTKPPEKTEEASPSEPTSDDDTARRPSFDVPSPPRPSVSPAPPAAKSLTSDVKELVEAVAQETDEVLAAPTDDQTDVEAPTPPSRSMPPRPKSSSRAYKQVKHTQKSWDNFADRVWEDLHEEEEEEESEQEKEERPEPQGSDKPESTPPQETAALTEDSAAQEETNNNDPSAEISESKGDSESADGVFLTSLHVDAVTKSEVGGDSRANEGQGATT